MRNDAAEHGQPFEWAQLLPQFLSSTLEDCQSEFPSSSGRPPASPSSTSGSSQSSVGDDRLEAKIDRQLTEQGIDPAEFEIAEDEHADRDNGHHSASR